MEPLDAKTSASETNLTREVNQIKEMVQKLYEPQKFNHFTRQIGELQHAMLNQQSDMQSCFMLLFLLFFLLVLFIVGVVYVLWRMDYFKRLIRFNRFGRYKRPKSCYACRRPFRVGRRQLRLEPAKTAFSDPEDHLRQVRAPQPMVFQQSTTSSEDSD